MNIFEITGSWMLTKKFLLYFSLQNVLEMSSTQPFPWHSGIILEVFYSSILELSQISRTTLNKTR